MKRFARPHLLFLPAAVLVIGTTAALAQDTASNTASEPGAAEVAHQSVHDQGDHHDRSGHPHNDAQNVDENGHGHGN